MRMDTRLPMMVQPPDLVNALAVGAQAAGMQNDITQQNALRNFLAQSGGAVMQGDQNALAQLAQFDPNAALGIMGTRQDMDQRALSMDAMRQDMDLQRQQFRMQAEQAAAQMTAAERAEQAAMIDRTLSGAAYFYSQGDQAGYNDFLAQNGLDPAQHPFEQFPAIAATYGEAFDAFQTFSDMAAPAETGFRPATQQELAMYGATAGQVGPDNRFYPVGGAGETININTGPTGVDYGNPGAGLVWQRNPADGSIMLDERGAPIAIPFQGGAAWQEQQAAEAAAAATEQQQAAAAEQSNTVNNIVLQDIGRAKEILDNASFFNPAAGFGSGPLQQLGGTNATNLNALLDTVRANIGFDRLQAMREASPTGGALGSLTERELAQLQAVLGSLSTDQSPAQLRANLDRLEQIYSGIAEKAAAYPNAAEFGFADAGAVQIAPTVAAPNGVPMVTTDAEYEALPSGAIFTDETGARYQKP